VELKQLYTPSEMLRLGDRVKFFLYDDYSLPHQNHEQAMENIQTAVKEALKSPNTVVYTGHHKDNDWTRTFYWEKGWHIVNRTGDYAVVCIFPCE
jgi:uncharacterized membrane protein YfhO